MTTKAKPDKDFSATAAPADTRPASLWPETTRPGTLHSTQQFAVTHFDPLAEDRKELDEQTLAAFDVCHPALALRAVVLVQAVLAIVALGGADTWFDWCLRQAARPRLQGERPSALLRPCGGRRALDLRRRDR